MRSYLVQHDFPDGFFVDADATGAAVVRRLHRTFARHDVRWIEMHVAADGRRGWCRLEAPDRRHVIAACEENELPIHVMSEVATLDPDLYCSAS